MQPVFALIAQIKIMEYKEILFMTKYKEIEYISGVGQV